MDKVSSFMVAGCPQILILREQNLVKVEMKVLYKSPREYLDQTRSNKHRQGLGQHMAV